MNQPTDQPNARAHFNTVRIHNRVDGTYTLLGDATLSLTGTDRQLITWLITHAAITCSEVWFQNEDEPVVNRLPDIPEFWKPALIVTQRHADEWIVNTFGKYFATYDTVNLLLFLVKLLPNEHQHND